ncbi:hypothetical protein QW71_12220 [Paenibacillus sp. IHB B 3415]|nr:hypothetical protein QW71_12220 [Paenibacillus sp. IHB B 3415]
MRKTEYNVPMMGKTSRMYAKNRIQCSNDRVDEPDVCEKPNTMWGMNTFESAESGMDDILQGEC